jgi:hypothetical protein
MNSIFPGTPSVVLHLQIFKIFCDKSGHNVLNVSALTNITVQGHSLSIDFNKYLLHWPSKYRVYAPRFFVSLVYNSDSNTWLIGLPNVTHGINITIYIY